MVCASGLRSFSSVMFFRAVAGGEALWRPVGSTGVARRVRPVFLKQQGTSFDGGFTFNLLHHKAALCAPLLQRSEGAPLLQPGWQTAEYYLQRPRLHAQPHNQVDNLYYNDGATGCVCSVGMATAGRWMPE